MEPTFEQYVEGHGAMLECPACGGNYLRHEKIEAFERNEDQAEGLHISISNGVFVKDNDLTGNPSSRLHGLSIHFKCENCPSNPVLTIAQHKGNTWVDFIA